MSTKPADYYQPHERELARIRKREEANAEQPGVRRTIARVMTLRVWIDAEWRYQDQP